MPTVDPMMLYRALLGLPMGQMRPDWRPPLKPDDGQFPFPQDLDDEAAAARERMSRDEAEAAKSAAPPPTPPPRPDRFVPRFDSNTDAERFRRDIREMADVDRRNRLFDRVLGAGALDEATTNRALVNARREFGEGRPMTPRQARAFIEKWIRHGTGEKPTEADFAAAGMTRAEALAERERLRGRGIAQTRGQMVATAATAKRGVSSSIERNEDGSFTVAVQGRNQPTRTAHAATIEDARRKQAQLEQALEPLSLRERGDLLARALTLS